MHPDLKPTAAVFHQAGHRLLITGTAARRIYLGQHPGEVGAWTDADLIFLARTFDEVNLSVERGSSAELTTEQVRWRLRCDPVATSRPRPDRAGIGRLIERYHFTADGLVYDPQADRFHDPLDCRLDIRARVLRRLPHRTTPALGGEAVMRAAWLESEEAFTAPPDLDAALNAATPDEPRVSVDRLREGLSAVLTAREPLVGLARLDQSGWLSRMLPELDALKGCPQDKEYHPEGDVFTHTLECFRRLHQPPLGLALGVLLHDVAKPVTLSPGPRLAFPGHAPEGAYMTRRILRRLGYPAELIEEVAFYVRHHLVRPELQRLGPAGQARFVRHPWFDNLLHLYRADIRGSSGDMTAYREVLRLVTALRGAGCPTPGVRPAPTGPWPTTGGDT